LLFVIFVINTLIRHNETTTALIARLWQYPVSSAESLIYWLTVCCSRSSFT